MPMERETERILPEALEAHVQALAGEIGERHVERPRALHDAADYVAAVWRGQGYEVAFEKVEAGGGPFANVVIARRGSRRPEELVVVGAHYDTVPGSPGADDNASGVSALLEISRPLAEVETERTVRLVAFVNEEAPHFLTREMGSLVHAFVARRRGEDVRAMLSLEMLGYFDDAPRSQRYPPLLGLFYPPRGNFIAFVSNLRSRALLRRAVKAFRSATAFPVESLAGPMSIPGLALSDHAAFWAAGYPALMVTDTAFYRNPHYHTRDDTPDRLDYEALAGVSSGLVGTIRALAADRE